MTYFTGSTGFTSAARIEAVINEFLNRELPEQTSARFANMWSSRAVQYREVELPYIVGAGKANTAAGWLKYIQRLNGSTWNITSAGVYGRRAIPSQAYRVFLADRTSCAAETTGTDGTTDADIGRRAYQFLVSTVIDSAKYRAGGISRSILVAWLAGGTSAAPTS